LGNVGEEIMGQWAPANLPFTLHLPSETQLLLKKSGITDPW